MKKTSMTPSNIKFDLGAQRIQHRFGDQGIEEAFSLTNPIVSCLKSNWNSLYAFKARAPVASLVLRTDLGTLDPSGRHRAAKGPGLSPSPGSIITTKLLQQPRR